jgi:membrane protease YdiL (CAAX protease family)
MRPLRIWLIYFVAVFGGGALAAPWLYWLVQGLAEQIPALSKLADHPFHRFVNRSLLVLALVGLWPVCRALGIRSWREVGWVSPQRQWCRLGRGFAVGFVSLAIIALLSWMTGARAARDDLTAANVLGDLAQAGMSAVVVSMLEETLFRGAVFGTFRRAYGLWFALSFSSAVYAIVHFFARVRWDEPIVWHAGFAVLGRMLQGFWDLETVVPGFFNLLLAGALLALVFERTGNLYGSIGLHAGWIFWLKSYNALLAPNAAANVWVWGTNKLIDGWLALPVLGAVLVVFLRTWPRRARPSSGEPA